MEKLKSATQKVSSH